MDLYYSDSAQLKQDSQESHSLLFHTIFKRTVWTLAPQSLLVPTNLSQTGLLFKDLVWNLLAHTGMMGKRRMGAWTHQWRHLWPCDMQPNKFCCLNQPTAQRTLDPNQRLWCVSQVLYMVSIHPDLLISSDTPNSRLFFLKLFQKYFLYSFSEWWKQTWRHMMATLSCFVRVTWSLPVLLWRFVFSCVFNCGFTSCFCSFPLICDCLLNTNQCLNVPTCISALSLFPVSSGFFF